MTVDTFAQEIRHAMRALRRSPAFTIAAALTLALGIAANTVMFSIVNTTVLKPLPYDAPERIVRIFETKPRQPDELRSLAHPTLDAWRSVKSFEAIALFSPWSLDILANDRADQVHGAAVSNRFFSVMRTQPAKGRGFTEQEYLPKGPLAIILSDKLWKSRFNGDASIVGKTAVFDRMSFTIVGVMPQGFAYPSRAEFWVTTGIDPEYDARQARHLSGI